MTRKDRLTHPCAFPHPNKTKYKYEFITWHGVWRQDYTYKYSECRTALSGTSNVTKEREYICVCLLLYVMMYVGYVCSAGLCICCVHFSPLCLSMHAVYLCAYVHLCQPIDLFVCFCVYMRMLACACMCVWMYECACVSMHSYVYFTIGYTSQPPVFTHVLSYTTV